MVLGVRAVFSLRVTRRAREGFSGVLLTFCFFLWVQVTWVCSLRIFIELHTYDACTFYMYVRFKRETKFAHAHTHTHTKSATPPLESPQIPLPGWTVRKPHSSLPWLGVDGHVGGGRRERTHRPQRRIWQRGRSLSEWRK